MSDIDGNKPEMFVSLSPRGPGKTTGWSRVLMQYFFGADLPHLKRDEGSGKFVLLVRWKYQVADAAAGRLTTSVNLWYPDYRIVTQLKDGGSYGDIFLVNGDEKEHIGYTIPINKADRVREISSFFYDVDHMWLDEMIPEYGGYVPKEVEKFMSIVTSIARGGGSARRYLPVYMSGNLISTTNRYFSSMVATSQHGSPSLSRAIPKNAKRFAGPGYVFQRFENNDVIKEQQAAGISRAFAGLNQSAISNDWAFDQTAGIVRPTPDWGPMTYVATLKHTNQTYSLRRYSECGLMHISTKVDSSSPFVYRLTIDDHPNIPMLRGKGIGPIIRRAIESGTMTYENQDCYEVALEFMV